MISCLSQASGILAQNIKQKQDFYGKFRKLIFEFLFCSCKWLEVLVQDHQILIYFPNCQSIIFIRMITWTTLIVFFKILTFLCLLCWNFSLNEKRKISLFSLYQCFVVVHLCCFMIEQIEFGTGSTLISALLSLTHSLHTHEIIFSLFPWHTNFPFFNREKKNWEKYHFWLEITFLSADSNWTAYTCKLLWKFQTCLENPYMMFCLIKWLNQRINAICTILQGSRLIFEISGMFRVVSQ